MKQLFSNVCDLARNGALDGYGKIIYKDIGKIHSWVEVSDQIYNYSTRKYTYTRVSITAFN